MNPFPHGVIFMRRTAQCQQSPCWRELGTSGGEKGALAAVGQECDSTDTSECLWESRGFYTRH